MGKILVSSLVGVSLVGLLFLEAAVGQIEEAAPNVVLIIADQMRGDALSTLGNPNAHTPNLDRMAAEGVLFENYFANSSTCVPSRMSIFSGRYPHQHGTLTNSGERLQSAQGTLLGYFHERGYRLGWFGKDYHAYERAVLDRLLDANESRGREPFRTYNKFVPPYWHGDMWWPNEQLYASKTTKDGLAFIRSAKGADPFFLVLSYFDPHPPYFAPAEVASQYDLEEIELPPYVPPEKLSGRLAEYQKALHYDRIKLSDLKAAMKYYYASIEWGVDRQVGRILHALEKENLSEETIVIFTSEHGDFMGEHHMLRKGMFLYDALLHVPLIWYAPGRIERDLRLEVMAQGVDIFPTLVDITGGNVHEALPGRSLKPFLQGETGAEKEVTVYASAAYSELPSGYFEHPEPPPFDPPQDSDVSFHTRVHKHTWKPEHHTVMARTKEWKLIVSETRPPELYRMAGGWVEKENVAGNPEYRGMLDALRAKIEAIWLDWEQR